MLHLHSLSLIMNIAYLVKETSALYLGWVSTVDTIFVYCILIKKKSLELADMKSILPFMMHNHIVVEP